MFLVFLTVVLQKKITFIYSLNHLINPLKNNCQSSQVPVAHTCNPTYLGAEIQRIKAQGQAQQIVCERDQSSMD
jgi:hypothetical protein